jgi:hypothetical protein
LACGSAIRPGFHRGLITPVELQRCLPDSDDVVRCGLVVRGPISVGFNGEVVTIDPGGMWEFDITG